MVSSCVRIWLMMQTMGPIYFPNAGHWKSGPCPDAIDTPRGLLLVQHHLMVFLTHSRRRPNYQGVSLMPCHHARSKMSCRLQEDRFDHWHRLVDSVSHCSPGKPFLVENAELRWRYMTWSVIWHSFVDATSVELSLSLGKPTFVQKLFAPTYP